MSKGFEHGYLWRWDHIIVMWGFYGAIIFGVILLWKAC
jgi:hypothetical protein